MAVQQERRDDFLQLLKRQARVNSAPATYLR
jgi:hypothetical protein